MRLSRFGFRIASQCARSMSQYARSMSTTRAIVDNLKSPCAVVNDRDWLQSYRRNILDTSVYLTNIDDDPSMGGRWWIVPRFPNAHTVIVDGCDRNWIYSYLNQTCFPKAKTIYFTSDPGTICFTKEFRLSTQFFVRQQPSDSERKREHWKQYNVQLVSKLPRMTPTRNLSTSFRGMDVLDDLQEDVRWQKKFFGCVVYESRE
jgi:hypothetical protein